MRMDSPSETGIDLSCFLVAEIDKKGEEWGDQWRPDTWKIYAILRQGSS